MGLEPGCALEGCIEGCTSTILVQNITELQPQLLGKKSAIESTDSATSTKRRF